MTPAEATDYLRPLLPAGTTVYTILSHVSASGMTRWIKPYVIEDGEPRWIGRPVADLLARRYDDKRDGIKCEGGGMDMGFELVYSLSRALWNDTPEAEEYRQANERPMASAEAGYMLQQRWL